MKVLNATEFSAKLDAIDAATTAYSNGLPEWVQLWMLFMMLSLVPGLVFMFRYAEARVLVASVLYSFVMTTFINAATDGPTLLWGLAHLLFWPIPVIYTALRFRQINWRSIYGYWLALACSVMTVSVIFDVRDVAIYFSS